MRAASVRMETVRSCGLLECCDRRYDERGSAREGMSREYSSAQL